MKRSTLYLIYEVVIVIAIIILLGFGLTSCKEIQYVPVHHYDTCYLSKTIHDSVLVKDSVRIEVAGDTVYIKEYKYIYKDHIVHDTLRECKIDSVLVPTPVEKVVVTNELTWWQKMLNAVGMFSLIALLMFVVCKIKR